MTEGEQTTRTDDSDSATRGRHNLTSAPTASCSRAKPSRCVCVCARARVCVNCVRACERVSARVCVCVCGVLVYLVGQPRVHLHQARPRPHLLVHVLHIRVSSPSQPSESAIHSSGSAVRTSESLRHLSESASRHPSQPAAAPGSATPSKLFSPSESFEASFGRSESASASLGPSRTED